MERGNDKAALVVASILVATAAGSSGAVITALLLSIAASSVYELVSSAVWRTAIPVVLLAVLTCALVINVMPAGACLCALPLATYDLVSSPLCAVSAAVLVLSVCIVRDAPAELVSISAVLTVLAALLSLRTAALLAGQATMHDLRDTLREQVLSLAEHHRKLEVARASAAESATLAERARISREIHDNVGHLLTRAVFQVEALVVQHAGDANVQDELRSIGSTIAEALDVTRTSVHALADDAVDLARELNAVARDSSIASVSVFCDSARSPSAAITRCFIAVATEALTNAVRHAKAHVATIRVVEYPAFWQLVISNDGIMPVATSAEALAAQGMGIASMTERVQALGGTLTITFNEEFVVFVTIEKEV